MILKQPPLDEVLHCAFVIQECNNKMRRGHNEDPLYPLIGVMDFVTELHELLGIARECP